MNIAKLLHSMSKGKEKETDQDKLNIHNAKLFALENKQEALVQTIENQMALIKEKEVAVHFHTNILKMLLKYPTDDVSYVAEKGHELYVVENELKDLKAEHAKMLNDNKELVDYIRKKNERLFTLHNPSST